MASRPARILFLADTHLGIDLPSRPRVERRRRGEDFFANFEAALSPALRGEVDLVVHGGDVLFRSRVPPQLVSRAFAPLLKVADAGVPVLVVPGNHERSAIPYSLLAAHARVHLFDRPRTYLLEAGGLRLALGGFPFERGPVRQRFRSLVHASGLLEAPADVRLLCVHQAVEGATVGPAGFTFRGGDDVVAARELPPGVAAVLSGHIHRHQALTCDLAGRPLAAPVLYPGSIERTSFAEKDEEKGYLVLEVDGAGVDGGKLGSWTFHRLPARPMSQVELEVDSLGAAELAVRLRALLSTLDPDGVVRLKVLGQLRPDAAPVLAASSLRELAPPTMNLTLATDFRET
ncbi:MAG: metallophosphoesterase family protein [Myxococcaceae bacterium]